jgi:glyoxylase-like metal-dependent hydrolase (beta-lactamase superfamily II)
MEIVALPGHCDDMVGLLLSNEQAILTGDIIFRFWSSAVLYGDGNLGDYFASLDKLQKLVRSGRVKEFVPAHGFPIDQPIKALEGYRAHRRERLAQIEKVVDSGAGFDAQAVVRGVYGDIDDPTLLRASLISTYAQLDYLAAQRGVEFTPDMESIAASS